MENKKLLIVILCSFLLASMQNFFSSNVSLMGSNALLPSYLTWYKILYWISFIGMIILIIALVITLIYNVVLIVRNMIKRTTRCTGTLKFSGIHGKSKDGNGSGPRLRKFHSCGC